ncbi:MAG: hypothetical protein ABI693_21740 [Bryobacteraceae bacterium]
MTARKKGDEEINIPVDVVDDEARLDGRGAVERLLVDVDQKLRAGEYKPGVADLIRLLQLRTELGEEQPKEITVTWVERETEGEEPSGG